MPPSGRSDSFQGGHSLDVAFQHWHEWAIRQRDLIVGSKPGITQDEYDAVAWRFAAVGIRPTS